MCQQIISRLSTRLCLRGQFILQGMDARGGFACAGLYFCFGD